MPRVNVYIEEGRTEGPPVEAWALDWPGSYAAGQTRDEALRAFVEEIRDYWAWLRKHGEAAPPEDEPVEVEVVETFQAFKSSPDYEVDGFFAPDAEPVQVEEIPRYLRLLDKSRADLLEVLSQVPSEVFEWKRDERTRTIRQILHHIARAEVWYLSCLPSSDPFPMLHDTRTTAKAYLGNLDPVQRSGAVVNAGEKWSARKVFRRFLYHERYHAKSIRRILEVYYRQGRKTSDGGATSDHA